MNDNFRQAYVFVRDILAGVLSETEEGYSFQYDKAYLKNSHNAPVSLTLPLQEEEYTSSFLFSFFDGLIPEGWLLNMVVHNWKLDIQDRFGILLVACKDPIGSVTIQGVEA